MEDFITVLKGSDHNKAYALFREIGAKSADSDEFYSYFDDFKSLICDKSSYVRTRGFVLCCAQAKWDTMGKLKDAFPQMLLLLNDPKPTVVRQCLLALHEVVLFRPELSGIISDELNQIDLSKYKDSMAPLIEKDIEELLKAVE